MARTQGPAAAHNGGERDTWSEHKETKLLLLEGSLVPRRKTGKSPAANFRGPLRPTSGGHLTSSSHLPENQPAFYCVPHPPLAAQAHIRHSSSGSEREVGSLTCRDSRALPVPLHLLPPGPQQAVVNSPKGTGTSGAGGRVGSRAKHSGKARFHTDVFRHKLGGWQSKMCARLLMTRSPCSRSRLGLRA